MFKQTRLRLVVLNSLVFFIILNILGFIMYFYMVNRLYGQIDSTLSEAATSIAHDQFKDLSQTKSNERKAERQVVYLVWDKTNNLLIQKPQQAFLPDDIDKLRPSHINRYFNTIDFDGHKYRSLSLPVAMLAPKTDIVNTWSLMQVVLNIDPETNILNNLVIIVLVGGGVGLVVSLLAGLFLANRALVPILGAWDKQQQFVADASHELRTPLTVIRAQLELLFHHPEHTIEQDSPKISIVLTEVERMIKLVSHLLTIARSDSNQLELNKSNFALDLLIEHTAERFKPLAEMKGLNLVTVSNENLLFHGDQERIHQLLIILLENSLKYTQKGSIQIICHKKRSAIRLSIEDTGIGVAPKDLPFIFERFYRGDKVRSRMEGGTGLGLAIAQSIVKAHQGAIWAESELEKGTKIHVLLPIPKK